MSQNESEIINKIEKVEVFPNDLNIDEIYQDFYP